MPLALLLQETVYTMRWGAFHLAPWTHLVRVEELLIDRARGAFLTHWFGRALPLKGSYVRIVIENLEPLRRRYLQAKVSLQTETTGPNLLEPLAGLTGELAGILLSPTTTILGITWLLQSVGLWTRLLSQSLGKASLGLLLQPLAGPILVALSPVLLLATPFLLMTWKPEEIRAIHKLLGAAARFLIAGRDFLALLLGPREKIRNPLLLRLLEFFDALAGLLPFALAAIAVIVVEIGPLIEPLAEQAGQFKSVIGEVFGAVVDIFKDVPAAFESFLPMLMDRIDFVLVQLGNVLPLFEISFTQLFTDMTEQLTALVDKASKSIGDWYDSAKTALIDIVKAQPVMQQLDSASISFGVAARALASDKPATPTPAPPAASATPSKPGTFSPPDLPSWDDYLRTHGDKPSDPAEAIAMLGGKMAGGKAPLFDRFLPFGEAARRGVEAALKPTRVFDTEAARLTRELDQPPLAKLAALRGEQLKLRELLTGVVGRVLPAEIRVRMGDVLDVLGKLDANLYQQKVERQDFPVLDLPDNGQLRPIVHRLVIRGIDMVRADADTFQQRLQEAVNALVYPATRPAENLTKAFAIGV